MVPIVSCNAPTLFFPWQKGQEGKNERSLGHATPKSFVTCLCYPSFTLSRLHTLLILISRLISLTSTSSFKHQCGCHAFLIECLALMAFPIFKAYLYSHTLCIMHHYIHTSMGMCHPSALHSCISFNVMDHPLMRHLLDMSSSMANQF